MSEFPRVATFPDPMISVSTMSVHSFGGSGLMAPDLSSGAYPVANLAIFIPFRINRPMIVANLFCMNATAVSGNIDMGIYTSDGILMVSKGSTAQTGTASLQNLAVGSTLLDTGLFYLAVTMDNTTGTFLKGSPAQAAFLSFGGVAQMASAFPLPSTATFATVQNAYLPQIGASTRAL